jgi:diguanylate cyclase (GGDEF)-like protein
VESRLLGELSEMLHVSSSPEEVTRMLPEMGARLFPHLDGCVYTGSVPDETLSLAAWWKTAPAVTSFSAVDCWALRLGRPHLVLPTAEARRCPHASQTDGRATLCIPMLAQGETIGVLHLAAEGHEEIPAETESLARSVADQLSLGLANLRLQETLRARALRDPLTSLFNRRSMEESLERTVHAAQRDRGSLAIMMLDVDHFKRYNDTYGHAGGDALLQQLGQLMVAQFRPGDIVCRYGGEEFLVIMPGADLTVATARAEQLRCAARDLEVHLGGKPLGRVTVSAGIAVYPDHAATAEKLMAVADGALYEAKHRGRDRVVSGPQIQEVVAV